MTGVTNQTPREVLQRYGQQGAVEQTVNYPPALERPGHLNLKMLPDATPVAVFT